MNDRASHLTPSIQAGAATSIQAFTGFVCAPDSTIPIRCNAFAGLTLPSPDRSRALDRYGVTVD